MSTGSDAETPYNFRVAGRKRSGALKKTAGLTLRHEGQQQPSIPSRLETVLYKGSREVKGFGSNALRFPPRLDTDAPGPGDYGAEEVVMLGIKNKASWSERGLGHFASKDTRFARRPTVRGGPGPGGYEVAVAPPPKANVAASSFARRKGLNPASLFHRPSPGPGTYDPRKPEQQSNLGGANLLSKDIRMPDGKETVGPGAYLDTTAAPRSPTGKPSRVFARPLGRKKIPTVVEGVHIDDLAVVDTLNTLMRDRIGPVPPGPGSYDVDASTAAMKDPVDFSSKPSSMFMRGRSDQPRSHHGPSPGPGTYEYKQPEERPAAASVFQSTVARENQYGKPHAPGPAFYNPQVTDNKSFHLNAPDPTGRRKWV
mmetsp:Transcript_42954/g.91082  ORF Transcript_42954/g.91082 Transcript_42954/m.91082 type:complete len:369 (-) Transcript_42954:130-1236(-)